MKTNTTTCRPLHAVPSLHRALPARRPRTQRSSLGFGILKLGIFLGFGILGFGIFGATPAQAAKSGGGGSGAANLTRSQSLSRSSMNNSAKQSARQNQKGVDGPIANIDGNWYLEYTAAYIKSGNTNIDKYFGASISLGYKVSYNDKFQIEIGAYNSNTYNGAISYTRDFLYNRWLNGTPDSATQKDIRGTMPLTGKTQARALMVPLLVTYTYSVHLGPAERWEARVSPVCGFLTMFHSWKVRDATGFFDDATDLWLVETPRSLSGGPLPGGNAYTPDTRPDHLNRINATENFSGRGVKTVFALGAGFGLSYHISDTWYADIGYRWLWSDKTTAKLDTANGSPWNAIKAWAGMNTNTYTLTLGRKF